MRNLCYILLLLTSLKGFTQEETFPVRINAIATEKGKVLKNVEVIINDGKTKTNLKTEKDGKLIFGISKHTNVSVTFKKDGYVSKTIVIDSENDITCLKTCTFNIEIGMIKKENHINYEELNFPVARIRYCKKTKKFKYDIAYNRKMYAKQQKILKKIVA